MATWDAFQQSAPELADFGAWLFKRFQVALLASTRADGAPAIAPVTPVFASDSLFLWVNPLTPKFRDLRDRTRYVLHSLMELGVDSEFQISGRAKLIEDPAM